jgi:hypothetical protein
MTLYCSICTEHKPFTTRKNLYKHYLTKKHIINANQIKINYCNTCLKQFSTKNNLHQHNINIHKVKTIYQKQYLFEM